MDSMDSSAWLAYFRRNAANNLALAWDDPHALTEAERRVVTASMQAFQLGEASEGKTLLRFAEQFAAQAEDPFYVEAVKLFIREENRHSGYLRTFMQEHAIPRAETQWSDGAFRLLRRLAGLELSIRVLVTAEMIARVYYPALGASTKSPKLAMICRRMATEESIHVRFQMGAIGRLKASHSRLGSWIGDVFHGVLMVVTTLVVWCDHRAVLKAHHQTYASFLRAAWAVFADGLHDSAAPAARQEALCETL